jgi:hypothetical protein
MNKLVQVLFFVIVGYSLSSCSVELIDYKKNDKPFELKDYFNGNLVAWGIVQDYSNEVKRRFCVELDGTWDGDTGVLAESFYFTDGEVSYRNWQLSKQTDGSYKGTADDVVGIAIGEHQGFAFQFKYTLSLKVDDETYQVSMDDWMYQIDEYRVMNKTSMSKLGVEVARITLFFDKEPPIKTCQSLYPI